MSSQAARVALAIALKKAAAIPLYTSREYTQHHTPRCFGLTCVLLACSLSCVLHDYRELHSVAFLAIDSVLSLGDIE